MNINRRPAVSIAFVLSLLFTGVRAGASPACTWTYTSFCLSDSGVLVHIAKADNAQCKEAPGKDYTYSKTDDAYIKTDAPGSCPMQTGGSVLNAVPDGGPRAFAPKKRKITVDQNVKRKDKKDSTGGGRGGAGPGVGNGVPVGGGGGNVGVGSGTGTGTGSGAVGGPTGGGTGSGSGSGSGTGSGSGSGSGSPPPGPVVRAECGDSLPLSERARVDALVAYVKTLPALPPTSSGIVPERKVGFVVGQGRIQVTCYVAFDGSTPVYPYYSRHINIDDEDASLRPRAGESVAQRFTRLRLKYCDIFSPDHQFSVCSRAYEDVAQGFVGAMGPDRGGYGKWVAELGGGATAFVPRVVPERAQIDKLQYQLLVNAHQFEALTKRMESDYAANGCGQSCAQLEASYADDLRVYPQKGQSLPDPRFQVGYGYEWQGNNFSRLGRCALAYGGYAQLVKEYSGVSEPAAGPVMAANESCLKTRLEEFLGTRPNREGNPAFDYENPFRVTNAYDWDNSIKTMPGLYAEQVRIAKGGIIKYCSTRFEEEEKAIRAWASKGIKDDDYVGGIGSGTFRAFKRNYCDKYKIIGCQEKYPSSAADCGTAWVSAAPAD